MAFVAAVCPQCSGALQVPDDRDIVKCMYCGVDVVVRQAIQLVSGSPKNFLELAKSAAAGGNQKVAYEYFSKVLENDPKNAEAWFGKGTAAGWMSNLNDLRFSEMTVAYENGLDASPEASREALAKTCAVAMNAVAVACYQIARKRLIEFEALPNTWAEYLVQCRQVIALCESALRYAPGDRTTIENVIFLCKDNIEGVKFNDPYNEYLPKTLYLSDAYEAELRALLTAYAAKLTALDPNYVAPNPQRPSGGCFVVTATMGDESHPAVVLLRAFRDESLSRSRIGRVLISEYNKYGPTLAAPLRKSEVARVAAYVLVVAPAVCGVRILRMGKSLRPRGREGR